MAMRAGAVSRAAGQSNRIALPDILSFADEEGAVVPVPRRKAVRMTDFHQIPVAVRPAGARYDAVRRSVNGRIVIRRNIDAFVIGRLDPGTLPPPDGTRHIPDDRPDGRNRRRKAAHGRFFHDAAESQHRTELDQVFQICIHPRIQLRHP